MSLERRKLARLQYIFIIPCTKHPNNIIQVEDKIEAALIVEDKTVKLHCRKQTIEAQYRILENIPSCSIASYQLLSLVNFNGN